MEIIDNKSCIGIIKRHNLRQKNGKCDTYYETEGILK
jgi:hypothetical protein